MLERSPPVSSESTSPGDEEVEKGEGVGKRGQTHCEPEGRVPGVTGQAELLGRRGAVAGVVGSGNRGHFISGWFVFRVSHLSWVWSCRKWEHGSQLIEGPPRVELLASSSVRGASLHLLGALASCLARWLGSVS